MDTTYDAYGNQQWAEGYPLKAYAEAADISEAGPRYGDVYATGNANIQQGDKYYNSRETYQPDGAQLQAILDVFLQEVDDDIRKDLFKMKNVEELYESLEEIQRSQAKVNDLRSMVRMEPFIVCLMQYHKAIECLPNANSEILAAIWVCNF